MCTILKIVPSSVSVKLCLEHCKRVPVANNLPDWSVIVNYDSKHHIMSV